MKSFEDFTDNTPPDAHRCIISYKIKKSSESKISLRGR